MSGYDLEIQKKLLFKQFSTIVELLGKEWVVQRPDRNRHYEQRFGANSPRYTEKYKTIDDLNEICEILQSSQQEYIVQKRNGRLGRTDREVEEYNR